MGRDAPPINISSVPEDKARRSRQSQRCRNRQAEQLRGWSRLPRLNYLDNQISAGALRRDHAALGDSDKPAGKIPSEMQKRCTGEKRLLITADENGLLIGWRRGGSAERLRGPRPGGQEGCPHGFLCFGPRMGAPGVPPTSGMQLRLPEPTGSW